uniref:T-box domain-containing protein n=1 Tax=Oreochromis aureus TaxID=47969 RepID=A0A668T638_OREAU
MVFHQERATAPATATAASSPPSSWYVTPKSGKASEGGVEQAVRSGAEQKHPTSVKPQSDTLPPENTCRGVTVTLENHSMWNVFFRCGTEMILTEQGSRMFPYCRFRISGLQPSRRYTLMMDVQPLDNSHYRWTGKNWQAAGKGARHAKSQPFAHPESPATGQHWMQSPVSFYRMKLTNNISDRDGNTILHPMHRYLPRLHVVQTDKAAKDIKLSDPGVITFSFSQTEFMAVTAYQNAQFVQLKVDYNPFAKGLKEDGSSSWGGKLKANSRNLFSVLSIRCVRKTCFQSDSRLPVLRLMLTKYLCVPQQLGWSGLPLRNPPPAQLLLSATCVSTSSFSFMHKL